MTKLTSTFDFTGVDLNDPDAMESAWNRWVGDLFKAGFRPSENPIPGRETETTITYRLFAVAGVSTFGQEVA